MQTTDCTPCAAVLWWQLLWRLLDPNSVHVSLSGIFLKTFNAHLLLVAVLLIDWWSRQTWFYWDAPIWYGDIALALSLLHQPCYIFRSVGFIVRRRQKNVFTSYTGRCSDHVRNYLHKQTDDVRRLIRDCTQILHQAQTSSTSFCSGFYLRLMPVIYFAWPVKHGQSSVESLLFI